MTTAKSSLSSSTKSRGARVRQGATAIKPRSHTGGGTTSRPGNKAVRGPKRQTALAGARRVVRNRSN